MNANRLFALSGRKNKMSDIKYDDIMSILRQRDILPNLFDLSRIVEPESGKLVELNCGALQETKVSCNDVFGSDARCRNCTSLRAHYSNETVVKLEYAGGAVLLILSIPVEIQGRLLVVELAKDITKSMTVDVRDSLFAGEVPSIINKLNKMAATDPLTGLQNRRTLDERLAVSLDNCRQMGLPLSLAMIDIDHFKRVNDTYGHQCGDEVIKGVAGVIKSYVRRDSDFAVRYGGEEILLCLPGVSLSDCRLICARIHTQIEQTAFACEGHSIRVTVSMGVAGLDDDITTAEKLIALADERLYTAKNTGRNKIVSE